MSKQQSATKTAHSLKSPYTEPGWPVIPTQLEADIIDILISILDPIGRHRDKYVARSKGRNKGKRRRKETELQHDTCDNPGLDQVRPPEILQYLTVGFNSTIRCLESWSQVFTSEQVTEIDNMRPLYVVFVCVVTLPEVMTSTFPLLTATSVSEPGGATVRLIPMSQASAFRISQVMKQPRVNVLGLRRDTPGAEELFMLIKQGIEPVQVPWITEARATQYLPVKIQSEIVIPGKTLKRGIKRKTEESDNGQTRN